MNLAGHRLGNERESRLRWFRKYEEMQYWREIVNTIGETRVKENWQKQKKKSKWRLLRRRWLNG